MSSIVIDGNKTSVFDAVTWCAKEFGQSWGELEHTFPGWSWRFTFKDSTNAAWFAVRWAK